MQTQRVTICTCVSRSFIDENKAARIAAAMRKEGYAVTVEADLCKKVMNKSDDLPEIASGIIMACHARTIRSHMDWLGLKAGTVVDMRSTGADKILSDLHIPDSDDLPEKDAYVEQIKNLPVEEGCDAWYPVLDKERCRECGKCHDFCLFGVYAIENGRIRVAQPRNCKNNCPACARMCPSKAIIFPKYEKSPINGGLDEEEQFNPQETEAMYRERLRYKLQQRRAGVPLTKGESK